MAVIFIFDRLLDVSDTEMRSVWFCERDSACSCRIDRVSSSCAACDAETWPTSTMLKMRLRSSVAIDIIVSFLE